MDTLEIGHKAEHEAFVFLEKKGLKLLARNYHCIFGEIDLIMRDRNHIVFVEVRKRSRTYFASAIESVNFTKQRKLIKTATHYLQKQRWFDKVQCRFDVVGISEDQLEWIKDAFSAENF
jgi:putative endonuclease